ncbi:MAG: glycine cleavage system aminomethyltransferase GcvT [Pirellulaceae bacterium]|nr:glycine cleavage system aminomethyltransferase GcvT [Pirellulaceae bacterium]
MSQDLAKTALYQWHVDHQGRMVDFAGWSMPTQYTSIVEEHNATRQAATLFDVSHMGRFYFTGSDVEAFLDNLATRKVIGMKLGAIRYSLVTDENGGILDDVLIYRLEELDGSPFYAMVVNASNREKIAAWIESHLSDDLDVHFEDHTVVTSMIAVQGPLANGLVTQEFGFNPDDLKYYTGTVVEIAGHRAIVSRTGYTGEDGCEISIANEAATTVWEAILAAGQEKGVMAAGLGARDTLRLEAAMPLYGHELSEEITPVQAGLGFAVNLKERQFIGSVPIAKAKEENNAPVRVGFALEGRRVARQGYPIIDNEGKAIGEVTSGTFSPTLEKAIGMAYVPAEFSAEGTALTIDLRGKRANATVVSLPFYSRK